MERLYIIFEGRVQGVGFRYFCQYNATTLGLTGFVHNMSNGMVDMEVQGDKKTLDAFLSKILLGNRFIKVNDYSSKKIAIREGEKSFKIQ